jgi:hypothetical protein
MLLERPSADKQIEIFPTSQDDVTRQPKGEFVNSRELSLKEIRFVCDDDFLRPFWIDLLGEKWVSGEIFSGYLQHEYGCSEMLRSSNLDLNGDGVSEIAIRVTGICGTKDNCPLAFYEVVDDERGHMHTSAGVYDFTRRRLIFSKAAINYELRDSKHRGYHDILLRFSSGLYGSYLELYKFDGKIYQRSVCFDEEPNGAKSATDCWIDEY